MNTEITDIRRAHVAYRNADRQGKAFKNAEALLLKVHAKYGTANPSEIENLIK